MRQNAVRLRAALFVLRQLQPFESLDESFRVELAKERHRQRNRTRAGRTEIGADSRRPLQPRR